MRILGTIGFVLVISGVCAMAQTPPPVQPHPTTTVSTSSLKAKLRPFMGRVLRQNGGYVLKAGDLEYKIDDADAVRNYAGKNVKITGSLDRQSNTIHVEKVEPSL
ncbi:MAG: hypothetical protein JOZ80_12005 [Acidobacteriaceae bacterium]|nr:hypothetical protein [Acidobacteriaceae bacterium]